MRPKRSPSRLPLLPFALAPVFAAVACAPPPASDEIVGVEQQALVQAADDGDPAAADAAFRAWLAGRGKAARTAALDTDGVALAKRRKAALRALARTNPAEVLARALPPSATADLPPGIAAHVERQVDTTGELVVVVSDGADVKGGPFTRSEIKRFVRMAGGRRVEAAVFGRRETLGSKQRVALHGVMVDDDLVVLDEAPARVVSQTAGGQVVANVGGALRTFPTRKAFDAEVAALAAAEATPGPNGSTAATSAVAAAAASWTEGPKRVLYIRVDFPDYPFEPVSTALATESMNTTATFFSQNSYGKTSLSYTITPVLRMPRYGASYAEIDDYWTLLDDARAAARAAGFDPNHYDFDICAFTWLGGQFGSWAGRALVGGKGAWIHGEFNLRVTGHELGHNYGAWHANSWEPTDFTPLGEGIHHEYGNWFDIMSASGTELQHHFNTAFKGFFNWLTPADFIVPTTSGVYRITAHDFANATGARGIRIRHDDRDLYLEHRRQQANTWLQDGVMVLRASGSSPNYLIDTTAGDRGALHNAPLIIGQTLSDPVTNVHITPIAKSSGTPGTIDVAVNFGPFPGNVAPSGNCTANTTTVAQHTPVTFTASVTDGNGDPLSYFWSFDDNEHGPGTSTVSHTFINPGVYTVRCVVSDRKGGTFSKNIAVTVGNTSERTITGNVSAAGKPVANVGVATEWGFASYTDSSGQYLLTVDPNATYVVAPRRPNATFTPASRTVSVGTSNVTGQSFTVAQGPIRIDAGSPWSNWDSAGNEFKPDQLAVGGTMFDRGYSLEIENTIDDRLYQTERFGMTGYAVPIVNGSYEVKLHFAETYDGITAPGQRVFDIDVEGVLLRNLDVFAASGGRNRALVRSVNVKVTDGQLDIGFIARVQNTLINAIEILPAVNQPAIRVEAGGTASVQTSAGTFAADQGFVGGVTVDRGAIAIDLTTDDRLYQTERFSMTGYAWNVANGRYQVKLHFAETWTGITAAGQRVFHVDLEGTRALTSYDPFARAGGRNRAKVETLAVDVVDGRLDIGFTAVTQNPLVNAIELIRQW